MIYLIKLERAKGFEPSTPTLAKLRYTLFYTTLIYATMRFISLILGS